MKKSAKNYLTLTGGLLSLYFAFVLILSANEDHAAAQVLAGGAQPASQIWKLVVILLLGMLGFFCFAWIAVSHWNRRSAKAATTGMKNRLVLILTALTGGLCTVQLSVAAIGSLPDYDFSSSAVAIHSPKAEVSEVSSSEAPRETSHASVVEDTEIPEPEPSTDPVNNANGVVVVSDQQTITASLSADQPDQSVVLGKDLSSTTLAQCVIDKRGDTTSYDNTLTYGLNAAVLGGEGSTVNSIGSILNTYSIGAPGLAISGRNASSSVTDTNVNTSADSSPAFATLDDAYAMKSEKIKKKSKEELESYRGLSAPSLTVSQSVIETAGQDSPVFYSSGIINANGIKASAASSAAGILMPGSVTTIEGCSLSAGAFDARNNIEGLFIFENPEKSENKTRSELIVNASLLSAAAGSTHTGGAIFAANGCDAVITLNANASIGGFNSLLTVTKSSVELNAVGQQAAGNVNVDSDSSIRLSFTGSSSYTGAINPDQTAKEASLHLDGTSYFYLSGDTYLTEFTNDVASNSNIITNGYHIYVNGNPVV